LPSVRPLRERADTAAVAALQQILARNASILRVEPPGLSWFTAVLPGIWYAIGKILGGEMAIV
jgi:hypothetical protein